MKIRESAVAGRFYPGNPEEITSQLNQILAKESPLIDQSLAQNQIIGAVVPHAGYMFSAYQAIHFFEILKLSKQQFDTFIIINPNHTGYGKEISLDENDYWASPYGNIKIDKKFCDQLNFPVSADAHKFEHSGEVMLPLLQFSLKYSFNIVPITLSNQNKENAELVADAIIKANKILKRKICLIASSDFSHYVTPEVGVKMDGQVIEKILDLDPAGVYREVTNKDISICGFGPIMALMYYALKTDRSPKVKVLRKGNSGDIMPSEEVVDYVSILFHSQQ